MNKGILVVSFGTTYKETREKNINKVVDEVKKHFPGYLVEQAFSSEKIRSILANRDNIVISDISGGIRFMQQRGITHLYILPTHIIDGIENHRLKQILEEQRPYFTELKIAQTLLGTTEDYPWAIQAILDELKPKTEDIVLLIGHGTSHKADISYQKLEDSCQKITGKKGYVVTIEGKITIETVLDQIKKEVPKSRRILLIPFMLVAGEHAFYDIIEGEESIQKQFDREGYQTEVVQKGLGEYKGIRQMYLQHLEEVIRE